MPEIKIADVKALQAQFEALVIILEKKKVLTKKDMKKLHEHAASIEQFMVQR